MTAYPTPIMKSNASFKAPGQRTLLVAAASLIGAAAVAVFVLYLAPDSGRGQTNRTRDGTIPSGDVERGRKGQPSASVPNRWHPIRPVAANQSSDEAVIATKVMPHILDVTRKFIEENISASQTELNAAERATNPWLYQRLGLSKAEEEQAIAVIRKKNACDQRAMEAASLTNEDDAAFAGLKPYQDELDVELKGLLGKQYETYQNLKLSYEQVSLGNDRLPEDEKLADNQAHRLADLINGVFTKSAESVTTQPDEEEDYDELMKRVAADKVKITQEAGKFLTPGQIEAIIRPSHPMK